MRRGQVRTRIATMLLMTAASLPVAVPGKAAWVGGVAPLAPMGPEKAPVSAFSVVMSAVVTVASAVVTCSNL